MVHQELQPVLARSVGENLFLGRFPTKNYGPLKVIDHKKMYEDTKMWLDEVGMDFDPKAQLGSLSIGQMQSVEIAKAVSHQAKVVIFDEPTRGIDVGTKTEIQKLVVELAEKGMAVVFISSEVEEMLRTCDRMIVLRDGAKVGELSGAEMNQASIMTTIAGGQ